MPETAPKTSNIQKVIAAAWAWIGLDDVADKSERAWALTLKCGHTVYRRVAWGGVVDPETAPAPKCAKCEHCAGTEPQYRLYDDVRRDFIKSFADTLTDDERRIVAASAAPDRPIKKGRNPAL